VTLLDQYRASLKMREVEEFFDLVFYRPLAFLFVKAIYNTELTPNQITVISMLLGVLGGVGFAIGTPTALIIAAVLLVVYDVLDCSDGQLARLKKNGTRIGRILDGVSDYVVDVSVYIGIGIGFANASDDPGFWWLMLVAAGLSNGVHAMLVDYYRNRFLDVVLQRVSTFEEDLEAFEEERREMRRRGGSWFERAIISIYVGYSRLQRRLTSGTKEHSHLADADPKEYYRRNRVIIRLWLLLGPTTQITFLVVCALFNRLDIYIYGLVIAWNLWALLLYPFQAFINHKLKSPAAA
jgi:phosphatidylglycerophosphate synthase